MIECDKEYVIVLNKVDVFDSAGMKKITSWNEVLPKSARNTGMIEV